MVPALCIHSLGIPLYLCRYQTHPQKHPPRGRTDTSAQGHIWLHPCRTQCGSRFLPGSRRTHDSSRSRLAQSSCSALSCSAWCHSIRGSPPRTWCSRPWSGVQGARVWPAARGTSCSCGLGHSFLRLCALGWPAAAVQSGSWASLSTRLGVLYTGLPACLPVINFLNPAAALSSCQALLF